MATTLISAIGRGQKDTLGNRYRKVVYAIDGKPAAPTCFFVTAWISNRLGADVDTIHLIGTATSSWDALAEEINEVELWEQLHAMCGEPSGPGAKDEDLLELAKGLSAAWNVSVCCHVLAERSIDDSNAALVISKLMQLFPLHDDKRQIQLDTTHALRTLPLLATSALVMADAYFPGLVARTTLIYGELIGDQARGFAFGSVLKSQRIALATNSFFNGFDAELLIDELPNDATRLKKALRDFSISVQLHLFDQFDQRLAQLRNAIDQCPERFLRVRLENLISRLDQPTSERKLYQLANLYGDNRHFGSAILALAEAAISIAWRTREAACVDLEEAKESFKANLNRRQFLTWRKVMALRNRVAHGANLIDHEYVLTPQNMSSRFDEARKFVAELIDQFEQ